MTRPLRYAPGGMVFHVLNRGVGRRSLFEKPEDYDAFLRVLDETLRIRPLRICAYCLMPNRAETEAELTALRRCVNRGTPLGGADWAAMAAKQLGLESSLRKRGRPRNAEMAI